MLLLVILAYRSLTPQQQFLFTTSSLLLSTSSIRRSCVFHFFRISTVSRLHNPDSSHVLSILVAHKIKDAKSTFFFKCSSKLFLIYDALAARI
jgi:hypothetical protein